VSDVLYVLEIVVAFGLVIFIHELGHFLAAKWCGVHVRKFAIGFGPPLLKWQPGETEYSLRPIPLGGFVDLAGEHPDVDEEDNPRALWRRPAWQRATVFSAGVVMNAVLALLLFTVAPMVGMQVPSPVIGKVPEGTPAAEAGIQPGDRLVRINGEPVQSFNDVQFEVALGDPGTAYSLVVERPAEGGAAARRIPVTVTSRKREGDIVPLIGIQAQEEPVIAGIMPRSLVDQAGLQGGDHILAVGNSPVETGGELRDALETTPGPVTLKIERDGQTQNLRVDPSDLHVYEHGMDLPVLIRAVDEESPAEEAGIRADDRVVAVDGQRWPTSQALIDAIESTEAGQPIRLTLWRETGGFLWWGGTPTEVEVTARPRIMKDKDRPMLGIRLGLAADAPVQVGHVDPDSPAASAGLRPGDVILALRPPPPPPEKDEAPAETAEPPRWRDAEDWQTALAVIQQAEDRPVHLRVKRGEKTLTAILTPKAVPQDRLTFDGAGFRPRYVPLPRIANPLTAAKRSIRQTRVWFKRAYGNLAQILLGNIGPKALGGPVAIVHISHSLASRGVGTFIHFWGMISVFLAVVNFLPVPPFDGGHVLFVLIEKIKGGPVSMKVRGAVWGASWIAVLTLFVFITWQDISRLIEAW